MGIKNFYRKTWTKIRINGKLTEEFETNKGVKQGGVLSPIRFSIYINKLIEELKATKLGIDIGGEKVNALFYADDIILITEKREELQKLMNVVTEYSRKWRCQINRSKSQIVIYGPKRLIKKEEQERKWFLGGGEIERKLEYKYLGLEIQNSKRWNAYKERILRKAKK